MRSVPAAMLLTIAALAGPAGAQTAPAAKPKAPAKLAAPAARPATQTPTDTANAMAQAERLAIQADLAWAGTYNGAITGEAGERMVAAIKAFQTQRGSKPTGVLNPQERGTLLEVSRKKQAEVGWRVVTDMVTGAKVGLPGKLLPNQASDMNGSRWTSPTGTVQVQLARSKDAAATTATLAAAERKVPERKLDYSTVKPDFFVLSGLQGLKKVYVRGAVKDGEARVLTILYDQAVEGTMEPVTIVMSSAFVPFPMGAEAGPPPRKRVEYASGVVVGDGLIATDRGATDGCLSVLVAGHGHADRIADDAGPGLALLKLYGARGLVPVALAASQPEQVELVGVADPQSQGGGGAVTRTRAQFGGGALSPAPNPGFAGAAAFDGGGRLAGIVQFRPVVVAGPAVPAPMATLASPEAVKALLASAKLVPATTAEAGTSVVRVICVRK